MYMSTSIEAQSSGGAKSVAAGPADLTSSPATSSSETKSTSNPNYRFDVFLSCCATDKDWVERELFLPLRTAGIKVTWEWDFTIGVDIISAREEAVKNSRHTLVVLTKAWCSSPLTKDDALSARFQDPSASERKILPLIGEECEIFPESLRRIQAYDFFEASVRQSTLPKLLNDLGQSQQTVTEVMSQFAQHGIRALVELMRSPDVKLAVRGIETAFVSARDEIEELGRCKQMHEYFHQADNEFQDFKRVRDDLQELLRKSPDEDDDLECNIESAWFELVMFVNGRLLTCIQNLVALAATDGYRPEQLFWVPLLKRAIEEMGKASENREFKPLSRAAERLSQIFGEWPSRFDDQIHESAKRLKLSPVVDGLSSIRDSASRYEFEQDVAVRIDAFSRGIAALSELGNRVQNLVICHNRLQFVSGILETIADKCSCVDDIEKIQYALPDIEPSAKDVVPLIGANWAMQFQATFTELAGVVSSATLDDVDPKTCGKINVCLRKFRTSVATGFTQVDLDLLGLCKKLEKIGLELTETIRNLENE
jgi:TIR domain